MATAYTTPQGTNGNTVCGVNQLDIWPNGANYDMCVAGGSGTKVGYCYPTNAQQTSCEIIIGYDFTYTEKLYYYPWGPDTSNC